MAEKYERYWKLFAETTRYDGRIITHYITLVAESDEDYLEAMEFLDTAKYKGLYNPVTKKIDLTAFERQEFAWSRIGAADDEDFIET
jgi:cyclopropane fatty-acyl-phospholipid synthase-like methyltransferase